MTVILITGIEIELWNILNQNVGTSLSEIDAELAVERLGYQTREYLNFSLFKVFSFPNAYEIYTSRVGTLMSGSRIYSP